MAYCSNCGNQTEDTDRFCTGCGAAVAAALLSSSDAPPQPAPTASAQPPPQTGPLSRPAIPAGLDIANNWGLFLLAGGLLMGLIALFIDWQESGVFGAGLNGIDWIKESEWFADDGAEWWIGLLALLSFIGVGLLALTLLGKVVPGSPIPGVPGIGALGAVLLALGPLFTHVGFGLWWASVVGEDDAGRVWDVIWATDGRGIWLALAAGIVAFIGTAAVAKREGRAF